MTRIWSTFLIVAVFSVAANSIAEEIKIGNNGLDSQKIFKALRDRVADRITAETSTSVSFKKGDHKSYSRRKALTGFQAVETISDLVGSINLTSNNEILYTVTSTFKSGTAKGYLPGAKSSVRIKIGEKEISAKSEILDASKSDSFGQKQVRIGASESVLDQVVSIVKGIK